MDERDKARIGEEIEPGGRRKAPGRLALVQRFVNTHLHEFGIDHLDTATKATAWLRAHGLLTADVALDEPDTARLRRVREAIRALALANHTGNLERSVVAELCQAASTGTMRVQCNENAAISLVPAGRGADAVTSALLVIIHEAQLTGQWSRFKACRHCTYVFFDRSKNRSAAWCAMSICGNRTKNRVYRRRRARAASPPSG